MFRLMNGLERDEAEALVDHLFTDKNGYRARRRYRRGKRSVPPGPPGTKWCALCQDYQPVEMFTRDRKNRDGLASYCQPHTREKNRLAQAKRKDRLERAS